jgi:ferrous iron transport protein A
VDARPKSRKLENSKTIPNFVKNNTLETTLDKLQPGEIATIIDYDMNEVPLKLIEMGCMEGNLVEMLKIAPFGDPLYMHLNESFVAIRKEMAQKITVLKSTEVTHEK